MNGVAENDDVRGDGIRAVDRLFDDRVGVCANGLILRNAGLLLFRVVVDVALE